VNRPTKFWHKPVGIHNKKQADKHAPMEYTIKKQKKRGCYQVGKLRIFDKTYGTSEQY